METRYLKELKDVVYDRDWFDKAPDMDLYYIFRGEKEKGDLRYDITILNPGTLGREYIKTKGHEHKQKLGELYIVLEGKAIFLMQKRRGEIIEDVYAVFARKDEIVIIPSGYGHVTYNASLKEKLKIANWVSKKCDNEYLFFEKMQGACYYFTENNWIKNKNYKKIPELRFEEPLEKMPENLDFLNYETKS